LANHTNTPPRPRTRSPAPQRCGRRCTTSRSHRAT